MEALVRAIMLAAGNENAHTAGPVPRMALLIVRETGGVHGGKLVIQRIARLGEGHFLIRMKLYMGMVLIVPEAACVRGWTSNVRAASF